MRLVVLTCLFSPLYAAYPAADYFTRPDSASLNSNWSQPGTEFDVFSEGIRFVGSTQPRAAQWVGDSAPANDQYSIAVLDSSWPAKATGVLGGVGVRLDSATGNGYFCDMEVIGSSGTYRLRLGRLDANVKTYLLTGSSSAVTLSANYRLRMWVASTSLNCILVDNTGATVFSTITTTDSTYASGRVGFVRGTQNVAFAAWFGGEGTGSTSVPYYSSTARSVFVSATATDHGASGTESSPWPYLDFFADQARLPCGSTVYLRGGTYLPVSSVYRPSGALFSLTVSCASNTAITYRPYGLEQVLFDAQYACLSQTAVGAQLLNVTGNYSIIDGGYLQWRFTNSDNSCKVVTQCGSNPTAAPMRSVKAGGDFIKFRNLVINDNGEGITDNSANSDGTEQTGMLVFNNGWNAPDREHGHGNYSHNDAYATIQKTMRHGIYVRNYEYQTKLYSQTGSPVGNYAISDSVFIGGFSTGGTGAGNGLGFLVQGSSPENITFSRINVVDSLFDFNEDNYLAPGYSLTNSYIDGGWRMHRTAAGVATGNVFSRSSGSTGSAEYSSQYFNNVSWDQPTEAFSNINNNTYFRARTGGNDFFEGVTGGPYNTRTFSAWQGLGLDASSTYDSANFPAVGTTAGASSTNYTAVYVHPLLAKTGIVAIWNWKNSSTVSVDVSSILSVGDPYEIIDSQCGLCGAVATGTYTGGSIAFNTTLTSITAPGGSYGADPGLTCTAGSDTGTATAHALTSFKHATYFNAFIVRRRIVAIPVTFQVYNSVPNATQARIEWGYGRTTLDQPTQTISCSSGSACTASISGQAMGVTYYRVSYLSAGGATLAQSDVTAIPVI